MYFCEQALVYHSSYLYTVGGTTGYEYTCDIHRFDLKHGVWEIVYVCSGKDESEPHGRYRHELAFDGKMIYVLGGGTSSESYGFSVNEEICIDFFIYFFYIFVYILFKKCMLS